MLSDYKGISKAVDKMVNKYDRLIDSLKKQEMQADSLKKKYDSLMNGTTKTKAFQDVEKELKEVEKEMDKISAKKEKLNDRSNKNQIKIDDYTKQSETNKKFGNDTPKSIGFANKANNLSSENELIGDQLVKIDEEMSNLEDKANKLKQNLNEIDLNKGVSEEATNLKTQIELSNNSIERTKEEIKDLGNEIEKVSRGDKGFLGKKFDEVGEKVDKLKNRMTRMIGTVMVFRLLRKGLTKLSSGFTNCLNANDTFSKSLNQIKANLITAFTPVYNACLPAINSLMGALSKITGTIAVFVNRLFGNTAEQAKQNAKSLYSQAKATKKLAQEQENLSGFDKLEVVNEEKDTSGGAENNIDFSGEVEYSESLLNILLKVADVVKGIIPWVKEHKDLLLEIAAIIGVAFLASKILNFVSAFKPLASLLGTISGLFVKVGADGTKSFNEVGTGITIAIAGFVLLVKNIAELVTGWDTLDAKQKLIKIGMAALGTAAIALGTAIALGFSIATLGIGAVVAAIVAVTTLVAALTIKFFTEKDAIRSTADAQKELNEAQQEYADANESYVSAIDGATEAQNKLDSIQRKSGISGADLFNKVKSGELDYKNMTETQKEVYKAYMNNEEAQKKVTEATETLSAAKKKEQMASFANQLAIAAETNNYDEYKKSVVDAYEKGEISADEARDLMEKSMSRMSKASQKTFMEDLPSDITEGMNPDKYKTAREKFKEFFSGICDDVGKFFVKLFTETIPNKVNELKETLKTFFMKTLPNMAITGVESLVNGIIGAFEKMLNLPMKGINKVIEAANLIPGVDIPRFPEVSLGRVNIPRLATGAVLPPNKPFYAMLGDQKHGKNLEAPENLIRQIIREEKSNNNNNGTIVIHAVIEADKEKLGEASFEGIRLKEIVDGKQYFLQ